MLRIVANPLDDALVFSFLNEVTSQLYGLCLFHGETFLSKLPAGQMLRNVTPP